ncbi:MCAT [Bugula neritina]|uniref:[acyl-carrier-protein] S-malonyltransferase n=1 Tax=Bugula neritina TaxID=10212 RepID=A0A7J7KPY5_BUGNE|nr:MCAT [Bugula neritina]
MAPSSLPLGCVKMLMTKTGSLSSLACMLTARRLASASSTLCLRDDSTNILATTEDGPNKSSARVQRDPRSTSILLFPGQGSQFVGMGKKLLAVKAAHELFTIASDIVKFDLLKHCLEGPIEALSRTEICQVATLVTSVAALEVLKQSNPQAVESCVAAAGFSVGEYAALVMGMSLSFEDAVRLVHARAAFMQEASDAVPSGLMTVFLSHQSKLKSAMVAARQYCKERVGIDEPVCSVANYLFCDAKVIGGNMEALEFIKANLSEFGLRRAKKLPVSGAFHTKLMIPAAEQFSSVLKKTHIKRPILPVYSNFFGSPYSTVQGIRKGLEKQLYEPVKWEQLMHTIYQRPKSHAYPDTYEIGPGVQLGTILKMVNNVAHKHYHSVGV